MRIVHNPDHRLHVARHEMFRGRLVLCHETPGRCRPGRGDRLARLGLPAVFTMEGGYAVADVGTHVVNVLQGYAERAP